MRNVGGKLSALLCCKDHRGKNYNVLIIQRIVDNDISICAGIAYMRILE